VTGLARPSARCRSLFLEVSRYLDGELTPARRRAIERHIAACTCCGAMAERLRQTLAVCRATKKKALPRDVHIRATERAEALIARGARRNRTPRSQASLVVKRRI
jgi:anti-sigma factor RsiW